MARKEITRNEKSAPGSPNSYHPACGGMHNRTTSRREALERLTPPRRLSASALWRRRRPNPLIYFKGWLGLHSTSFELYELFSASGLQFTRGETCPWIAIYSARLTCLYVIFILTIRKARDSLPAWTYLKKLPTENCFKTSRQGSAQHNIKLSARSTGS